MWPMWNTPLDRLSCDLSFTEAISQRMQVPNRLKVADRGPCAPEEQRSLEEEPPASLRMQVPERIFLSEMAGVASGSLLGDQQGWPHSPGGVDKPLPEPFALAAVHRELPILSFVSQEGIQKHKHQAPQSRARKARTFLMAREIPQPALDASRLRQHWMESGNPLPLGAQQDHHHRSPPTQCPPFLPMGRIYSFQNVLQTLHFLGRHLFQIFWQPGYPGQLSAQETRRSLEEFGTMDVQAMRKQLTRISGRLRALEAQGVGWHRQELFFFSILLSACLFNLWLWQRR